MKYLVTYWSQTGNTKKVAETIFDALSGEKTIKPFDEVENPGGFDLIFVGFPVMQFGPPQKVKRILAPQTAGKKIALFVTHAMVTQSDDPQQQAMLTKEMTRCRDAFSASEIVGVFHCQGELSDKTSNELMSSNIPMLMEFAAMRPLTIGHPNSTELEQAQNFARSVTAP